MNAPAQQLSPAQLNSMARAAILSSAVERIQQVSSTVQSSLSSGNNVLNIVPRNVGLVKGFFVEIALQVNLTSADPVAVTPFGAANLLQQVIFNDLQNNTRIQTSGWHLHAINTARSGRPYGIPHALDRRGFGTASVPQTVVLTASPAIYTNNSGVAGNFFVVGGTVTVIAVSRNGGAFVATGAIAGDTYLAPGDRIQVTYSVIPTLTTFMPATNADNLPVSYGDNWIIQQAPGVINGGQTVTLVFRYYVPLAYSKTDLRGAMYANVVNATSQLQLTLNTNLIVGNAADGTLACYKALTATAPAFTVNSVNVTVYQHYLDQLPMGQQGPILPMLDLSTSYELKNTTLTGLAAGQDFPVPYSNYRSYLSTFFIYDNAGALNFGSDINYISLQSANYTNLIKVTPDELALLTYLYLDTGLPAGTYYLSHRDDAISTIQYGNMDLIVNPSAVTAGAQLLVGYEDLAMVNLLNNAGSLPGG